MSFCALARFLTTPGIQRNINPETKMFFVESSSYTCYLITRSYLLTARSDVIWVETNSECDTVYTSLSLLPLGIPVYTVHIYGTVQ